jgi:Domain of unknown function (DUF5666)
MKIANDTPAFARVTRRGGLLTLLAGALALAGCGGGDGGGSSQAAVSAGGTGSTDAGGSLSVGPISGMGSIIVNGVRFNDDNAKILDDDGTAIDRKDLKLGMMARVKGKAKSRKEGKEDKEDKTDEAEEITFSSALLGPIDSLPTASAPLKVLGQEVLITNATIFEAGLSLAVLLLNEIVEVHGFVDPVTNQLTATRIERKLLADVKAFKLQGTISNVTATSFTIGDRTITFDTAVELAKLVLADLIKGLHVSVRLDTTATPDKRHKAKHIRKEHEDDEDDRDEAEVKGTVTDFTSSAKFIVNGRKIDASGVTGLEILKNGLHIEVKGRLFKGVLVAKEVRFENLNDEFKFVLHGKVSDGTTDKVNVMFNLTSSGGIVVKVTVRIEDARRFANGFTEANLREKLREGATIEVKGVVSPEGGFKANGIRLEA